MNTGPINAVLQHIRHLANLEEFRQQSDGQLLERFLSTQEEAPFSALLYRHGPLVWRVCQRVLRHRQDVEDVFQATFLTLARKARAIRKQNSVASWLHGVAYRLARRLQMDLAGQQRLQDAGNKVADHAPDGADLMSAGELQGALDEELAGLQEKHRMPLILCYLEGQTRDEAAQQLGWSLRTLQRRLQEGRKLLARRLTRRGISLGLAALSAGLLQDAAASGALSPSVMVTTCQAGSRIAAGKSAAGFISTRALAITEAMVRSMFMTKLTITAALLFVLLTLGSGVGLWASWRGESGEDRRPASTSKETPRREDNGREDDDRRRKGKAEVPFAKADQGDPVKRGEYLVNMARCGDCHTPRTKTGELDMSKHLQGAPLWFVPKIRPKGELADRASDLTMSGRTRTWSEEKMVKFLSTGGKADFPMPQYHMHVEDARAVAAYLRSLPGRKKDARNRDD